MRLEAPGILITLKLTILVVRADSRNVSESSLICPLVEGTKGPRSLLRTLETPFPELVLIEIFCSLL